MQQYTHTHTHTQRDSNPKRSVNYRGYPLFRPHEKQSNRFVRSVCREPQLLTTLHSVATTKQHLVNWDSFQHDANHTCKGDKMAGVKTGERREKRGGERETERERERERVC